MYQISKCATALLALAALCSFALAANHPGAFGGSYSIQNVSEQGQTVRVTMNFRLFNGTGADLKNASIILSDHQPALPPKGGVAPGAMAPGSFAMPVNNHGSAKIVAIRTHRDLELKNITFHVPAFEYAQWQRGAHPVFFLSYQAANGGQVQMPVQLVRER